MLLRYRDAARLAPAAVIAAAVTVTCSRLPSLCGSPPPGRRRDRSRLRGARRGGLDADLQARDAGAGIEDLPADGAEDIDVAAHVGHTVDIAARCPPSRRTLIESRSRVDGEEADDGARRARPGDPPERLRNNLEAAQRRAGLGNRGLYIDEVNGV